MPATQGTLNQLRPTRQGARVVIGLLLFGLVILGGLYISPKAHSPAAPIGVPHGVPATKLRIVAYDLARQHPSADPMYARIAGLSPDYLLLQGVNEDDVVDIAETMKMEKSFHPQLYQRCQDIAGRKGTWGNLVLSRNALYEGAPIGDIRGGFGAIAVSIVDGKEFAIACTHFAPDGQAMTEAETFRQRWLSMDRPPTIVAVLASDARPPASFDFLPITSSAGGESFYLSGDWQIQDSGTVPNAGTGLAPRWIDIAPATAATQPAQPAILR
jgi:hypothetical protein